MQEGRATIGEIRKALGGNCNWVTRRLLKRAGVQFPTWDQIAQWADNPPAWFQREKRQRVKRQAEKATIICPGCDYSIKVKPSKARERKHWEGLYCGRNACDYRPPRAEGMITVIGYQAVGSFIGWRHEFPSDEQIASMTRARDIGTAAFATQPESPVQATIKALVTPAGAGHHLLTLRDGWSTGITVGRDGSIEMENPIVVARLYRMVNDGDESGIILRTFTNEVSHALPNGTKIPVKEIRSWYLYDGVFHPLTEPQVFAAHCTDADTGEPIPPERGVRYQDAYPLNLSS